MKLRLSTRGERMSKVRFFTVAAVVLLGLVVASLSFSSNFLYYGARQEEDSTNVVFETMRDDTSNLRLDTEDNIAASDAGLSNSVLDDEKIPSRKSVQISHLFSPYTWNDEFIAVSRAWRYAGEVALKNAGIVVEHICAVLPADQQACPSWARLIILNKPLQNYRPKRNPVPTYGEMFTVLRDEALGEFVMYTNADIATAPEFYIKAWKMLNEDLTAVHVQKAKLLETRTRYYSRCHELTVQRTQPETKGMVKAENLCLNDAYIYFQNLGGRRPHNLQQLYKFFRNSSMGVDDAYYRIYDRNRPDERVHGNAMTITRRQFTRANATYLKTALFREDGATVNLDALKQQFAEGDPHPGNDLFIVPRKHVPRWLTETPFIHLRPSGFLIGQFLKDYPQFAWRRIMSSPENMLTFHIGKGTDEWPERCELQPRHVLFEVAQFFTRTNSTKRSFWPPPYCQDSITYREYGTSQYCSNVPADFCRGHVRLACTEYWHQDSRDSHALSFICHRIGGRSRTLDSPFCEFCNDLVGWKAYKCTKRLAKECSQYPCS